MAFEKLSVPQAVTDTALTFAREHGEDAARQAIDYLKTETSEGERPILDEWQVEAIVTRKTSEAINSHLRERIEGKYNDKKSRRPGLVALIRLNAKEKLETAFGADTYDNIFDIKFEPVEDAKSEVPLFIAEFPDGGYEVSGDIEVIFSDVVVPDGEDSVSLPTGPASTSVTVRSYEIVTIAGNGGEYWQNQALNLDGTLKE